jgi:CyaY protein
MLNILKSIIAGSIPSDRRLAYAPGRRRSKPCSQATSGCRLTPWRLARQRERSPASCTLIAAAPALAYCGALPGIFEVSVMSLSEARFHDLVDTLQQTIEDAFDDTDLDVDLENSGGVLTVRFENGSQLIFSRQAPLRQLWLAARSGGFHFDYDEDQGGWMCDSSDEMLGEMLVRICREQAGVDIEFELD